VLTDDGRITSMRARTYSSLGLVALAGCLALLTACGKAESPSAPTPTTSSVPHSTAKATKACELVTSGEAAAALGVSGDLKPKTDTAGTCEYQAPNGTDSVTVTVKPEKYSTGVVEMVIGMLGKEKTKQVDDLGDAAFVYNLDTYQTQYHVWADGKYFTLVVNKITGAGGAAGPAQTLVYVAAPRL